MRFFFFKIFFSNHQSNTFVTVLLLYCDKPLLFEVVIEFFHSSALEKKVCSLRSAMTSSKKIFQKPLKKEANFECCFESKDPVPRIVGLPIVDPQEYHLGNCFC